jgi:uncharacterized protein (TIGR03437 family)
MPYSRLRSLAPLAAIGLSSAMTFAQPMMLGYRPAAAEFSTAMDRIITVSGNPNALHVYDPVSQKETTVSLVQPPLSLSLSPDGLHAAVGHDALISYVNLVTASVEKMYAVPVTAGSVVVSASWIYVMPTYVGGSVSVNLATGVVAPNNSVFYGSRGRLNAAVNAVYGTRDGLSPNDIEEYDISTGPITRQFDSPYHGDYCIFGPVWFSPDGNRIYTGCGTVFRASKDPKLDMYYTSTLAGVSSVGSLAESAAIRKLALIPGAPVYPASSTNDGVVMLFESTYLKPVGQFALTSFALNGASFQAHGKWVFFNAASTELYVLMEADQTSGLLNDFALQRIPLSVPGACGAAFASATANLVATGSLGTVKITAAPDCIYQSTSLSSWVQIVSGGYGSGNGTLTYVARPNPDSAPRSAVISIGGQTFTINQDGASAAGAIALLGYNAVDAAYDKPLDKIILVASNPDELHIYDPNAKSEHVVPLVSPPLCVSIRPDGMYAAVGHDGWVSYVNLQTGAVEKVFQVVTDVHSIILAGNGYLYLFPGRDWSDIYSLEISSGAVTATSAIYDGRVPRLYANGKYLYVGGSWFSKWDISQGVAKIVNTPTFGMQTCGNLWLTEDGRRAFTACAKAYTTAEVPAQDVQYNGTLSGTSSVVWADESAQQQATAVIPGASGYNYGASTLQAGDSQVQIYGDAFLGYNGAIPLPQFTVGGNSLPGHGRFVFWNKEATALYVIMQADATAQLLSGSGVAQISPSSAVQTTVSAVVNGASQAPGRIAPGEIVTITGNDLGPSNGVQYGVDPVTGKVNTTLSGTQVFFSGVAAPILYTSASQVKAIVPYEIGFGSEVVMQASYQGILSPGTTLAVASAVPGVFTVDGSGAGQALAVNQDGTICDYSHPAAAGSYITVYFTGGGTTNPPGVTGSVTGSVLKTLTQTALATVGNQAAIVTFAGAAPTFVDGLGQLDIHLADNTPSGPAQPLIVTVGINSSPGTATIAVR